MAHEYNGNNLQEDTICSRMPNLINFSNSRGYRTSKILKALKVSSKITKVNPSVLCFKIMAVRNS